MATDFVALPHIPISEVRSLLFVPADRADFIRGVMRFAPDGIVFDLQDSVPRDRKSIAHRQLPELGQMLRDGASGVENRPYMCVRINPYHAEESILEDVRAAIASGVDGVIIPEVRGLADIQGVDQCMDRLVGGTTSRRSGRPELLILCETPESIDLVDEIVDMKTVFPIAALLYGREDLTDHLGVPLRYAVGWTEPGTLYPRLKVIWAGKRRHLPVLDSTPTVISHPEIIASESIYGSDLGFTGRGCIHPAQVPVIDASYSPAEADVEWATRALDAYQRALQDGNSVAVSDGAMVDRPIALLHEKCLARADVARTHDGWKDQWRQAAQISASTRN